MASTTPYRKLNSGERVTVIDWTNVPAGGEPFRGAGIYFSCENAVARVRLDDGRTRSFNRGDVTPENDDAPAKREAREAADRHAAIADEHARLGLEGPACS